MIRARYIENENQFINAYKSINPNHHPAVTLHLNNDNIVLTGVINEDGDTIHHMKRMGLPANREQQVQELNQLAETLNQEAGAQFTLNTSADTGHILTGGYVDATHHHPAAANPNAEYATVWVHPERYANFNQAERNLTEALTNGEITATITTKDGHGYWGTVPTHTFTHNGHRYFVEPHNPNTFKEGTYTLTAANIINTHTTRPIDAGRMTIIATPAE